MYLMINVIQTEVLKFIEQIFSINSVLFECIHNFIFIIKIVGIFRYFPNPQLNVKYKLIPN